MQQIIEVECGDYNDNVTVFERAQYARERGDVEFAQKQLRKLQRHIIETGENSSMKFLLPKMEELLLLG